jgi:hypothetical protein
MGKFHSSCNFSSSTSCISGTESNVILFLLSKSVLRFPCHHRIPESHLEVTHYNLHPSTQAPIHWEPGALSLEVKRSGREADHSTLSGAEVKNTWSCTSTLPVRFHGMMLS